MEKYITIKNEDNEEILAEVLFTFKHEEENYVLFTFVNEITDIELEEEFDVLAYKYEELEDGEIGNLIEIPEHSSDWEIVEEMFNTFSDGEFGFEEENE